MKAANCPPMWTGTPSFGVTSGPTISPIWFVSRTLFNTLVILTRHSQDSQISPDKHLPSFRPVPRLLQPKFIKLNYFLIEHFVRLQEQVISKLSCFTCIISVIDAQVGHDTVAALCLTPKIKSRSSIIRHRRTWLLKKRPHIGEYTHRHCR